MCNNTTIELVKDRWWDDCLQLHYDKDDGSRTYETICFMNKSQLANYLRQSIDVSNDLCFGLEDGENLLITTNVCYLPATYASNNPVFITTDDYQLLDRYDMLEKAAELISAIED